MAQHATTLPEQQPMRAARHPRNVSDLERGLSLIDGAALVLYGMKVAQASVRCATRVGGRSHTVVRPTTHYACDGNTYLDRGIQHDESSGRNCHGSG